MKTLNSPWLIAMIMSSLVLSGCNDLEFDMGNEPEEVVEEPAPEPLPQPEPEPEPAPTAPDAASVSLVPERAKKISFVWTDVANATAYRLYENIDGLSGFSQVGSDIAPGTEFYSISNVPLVERLNAEYMLEACNDIGCTASETLYTGNELADAIGYVKVPNNLASYRIGDDVVISRDGTTLVIPNPGDDGTGSGINPTVNEETGFDHGSVTLFELVDGEWVFDAYIKPSVTANGDKFGESVDISDDGTVLVVGAGGEDSGISGDPTDNSSSSSGAMYVFEKSADAWSQTAYIKSSFIDINDKFGAILSVSGDGNWIAASSLADASAAQGIGGNEADNSGNSNGSVRIFKKDGTGSWIYHEYLKASDSELGDLFGRTVDLSYDGSVLAVGADDWDQADNSLMSSGGIYIFSRTVDTWTERTILASNAPDAFDSLGEAISLSSDGTVLVAGATSESSGAMGINGDESDNSLNSSGAVYVFDYDIPLGAWAQTAYIKSDNPQNNMQFGNDVEIYSSGNKIAVAESFNESNFIGFDENIYSEGKEWSGAVWLYEREAKGSPWSRTVVFKAPDAAARDYFGSAISVSGDGSVIAVGSRQEDGASTGTGGDIRNNDEVDSGAIFLY